MEAVMMANGEGAAGQPSYSAGTHRPYLSHLVRRGCVAVGEVDGDVVGFGASVNTGRSTHLADLFVLPSLHGGGLGRRLLADVLGDTWPRTTFASDDPRALPLYARAGMRALWPNLYLAGDPAALPPIPAGYVAEPATLEAMAQLEAAWTRVDRGPDLGYWASLAEARPFIVRGPAGSVVAAGLSRLRVTGVGRFMDHVQVAPAEDPGPALLTALRYGLTGSDLGGACVPGPSPLVQPLLEAGFRVQDQDTFMASDLALIDPERILVNTGLL